MSRTCPLPSPPPRCLPEEGFLKSCREARMRRRVRFRPVLKKKVIFVRRPALSLSPSFFVCLHHRMAAGLRVSSRMHIVSCGFGRLFCSCSRSRPILSVCCCNCRSLCGGLGISVDGSFRVPVSWAKGQRGCQHTVSSAFPTPCVYVFFL